MCLIRCYDNEVNPLSIKISNTIQNTNSMPLFGNKFSLKKTPLRKSTNSLNTSHERDDLVLDQRVVSLKLGEQEFLFEDGCWIPDSGQNGNTYKSNQKLKKKIQELHEENNMLQLKYEIVLNMLIQTTAEKELQQHELEKKSKR